MCLLSLLLGVYPCVPVKESHFWKELLPAQGGKANKLEKQLSHQEVDCFFDGQWLLECLLMSFHTAVKKEAPQSQQRWSGRSLHCGTSWPQAAREGVGIKQWKLPVWIITIIAFWKTTHLIPRKMSLEFARSSDGKNKMPFLEIPGALWFLEDSEDSAEKANLVKQFWNLY